MRWIVTVALAVGLARGALALDSPEERNENSRFAPLVQSIDRLFGGLRGLGDWQKQHDFLMESVGKVYERNGWTSEPDQFSLGMIDEVNEIPPWSPEERLNRAVEILGDRYLLDEDQTEHLRGAIVQEATGLFLQHAGRIAQYAGQAIQARVAGEPFTAEQIAQWVQLAEPVFRDARERMRDGAHEFLAILNPEQRAVAQADFDALNRRLDRVEDMNRKWARGEWQATDWGMEDDPIQKGGDVRRGEQVDGAPGSATENGRRGGLSSPAAAPASPANARARATTSDAWSDYVRRFIQKYRLDETQQARAWRIGDDVRGWAAKTERQHAERAAATAQRTGASTLPGASLQDLERRHSAAIQRLWDQLVRRLERLPTRAQRRGADPTPLPVPAAAAPQPPLRAGQEGP